MSKKLKRFEKVDPSIKIYSAHRMTDDDVESILNPSKVDAFFE